MTSIFKLKKYQIKNQFHYYFGCYFHTYLSKKAKVFGIGLNRTGSTSLGTYFQKIGYKHSFEIYTIRKINQFLSDDKILKKEMNRFDMHEDWPSPLVYKKLSVMYPDAKFILTMRDNPDVWFASLMNTSLEEISAENFVKKLVYGHGKIKLEHKNECIDRYNSHNSEVIDFFKNTNKLLVLKTGDKSKELKILQFIGSAKIDIEYPHSQKRKY